jgi:(p)ppGpp synthase/HD superfamily hydrolase
MPLKLDVKTLLPVGRKLTKVDLDIMGIMSFWKLVYLGLFLKNNPDLVLSRLAFEYLKRLCRESGRLRADRRGEFIHPYRVAQMAALYFVWYSNFYGILLDRRLLDQLIALCLLHDAIEDFQGAKSEIFHLLGKEMLNLIMNVTFMKGRESKREYRDRFFSHMISLLAKSFDRMHNTKNMIKHVGENGFFTPERIMRQDEETRDLIIPGVERIVIQSKVMSIFDLVLRDLRDAVEESRRLLENYHLKDVVDESQRSLESHSLD